MKIAVAMSGGVDSSTAAAILHHGGHDVVGFTMQLWNQNRGLSTGPDGEPLPSRCCSPDDVYDARRVAEELSFPFYVLNLERDFERHVVQPFVASYMAGETPIPCIACNSRLKFSSIERLARSLDCDRVATGHYARVRQDEKSGRYQLLRGCDQQKDQSYFLWELSQEQLAIACFPLGEMSKEEVRGAARSLHLAVADKAESQEICFVPDGNYAGFIERYLETEDQGDQISPGEIVDTAGHVLGQHTGVHHFTVGQRRGLGIASPRPFYVLRIEPQNNLIVAGDQEDLFGRELIASNVNWIAFAAPPATGTTVRVEVRIRYRHLAAPATIESFEGGRARVLFDEPQRAITPGQAAVFYRNDEVLGGGWIVRSQA